MCGRNPQASLQGKARKELGKLSWHIMLFLRRPSPRDPILLDSENYVKVMAPVNMDSTQFYQPPAKILPPGKKHSTTPATIEDASPPVAIVNSNPST